ncbi:hypothetical protein ACF0H5_002241 [Mactra antiquata]
MACKKKGLVSKLRIPVDRRESESYLLSPEMMSPSQFSLSNSYSYSCIDGFQSPGSTISRQIQSPRHNYTMDSNAPLLPGQQMNFKGGWNINSHNGKSGVGDLEHIHIDGMNQNKNYDYADYGHQYEELPSSRKSIAKCNMDSGLDSRSEFYQSSGGATDIVSDIEDTTNIVNGRGEKRKRVNPLYDAMTQSMPSIYNKTKPPVDEKLRKQVFCLKLIVVVLLVCTFCAVAISVFSIISHNQTKDDPDPLLTPQVEKLNQDFTRLEELLSSFDDNNDTIKVLSDLIKKVNHLESNVSMESHKVDDRFLTVQQTIDRNTQSIMDSHSNLSSIISYLNMTIQLQLHNISKQPGPRGPQGVANFSRCMYYNLTSEAPASDTFPNYSVWAPTEVDLENNVALFASCTVTGGTKEYLEVHPMSSQKIQYRCKCSGTINGLNRRECTVHIFTCPRQS